MQYMHIMFVLSKGLQAGALLGGGYWGYSIERGRGEKRSKQPDEQR